MSHYDLRDKRRAGGADYATISPGDSSQPTWMFVEVDEPGAGGNSFHPRVSQGNASDTTHFVFAKHGGAQGARASRLAASVGGQRVQHLRSPVGI